MKINFIAVIISLLLLSNCQSRKDMLTKDQEQEITDTLKSIATGFLCSWEPPFYPERALKLFTQTEDFCLIIDGFLIENYNKWAEGVPNFMADDYSYFSSYKHEIKEIKTVVLNKNAGVVTIIYIWDSIQRKVFTEKRMVHLL